MFPLPYQPPFALFLYLLFGADLALLACGLALGRYDPQRLGRLPLPLRMTLSAILVLAALLHWQLARAPLFGCAGWAFLGMALGFLGDLIMARLVQVPDRLTYGMLAFGLGHISYSVALWRMAQALGLWDVSLALLMGALTSVAAVALWYHFVRKPGGLRSLNLAALAYSVLMATMNALALLLAIGNPRFVPLALGTVLFLASDLVLGNWNIRGRIWKGANDVVWVTYNLGQALIVFSVAAAANVTLLG